MGEGPIVESMLEDIIWNLHEYTSTDGMQKKLIEGMFNQFSALSDTGALRGFADCNSGGGGTHQINDSYLTLEFGFFGELSCGVVGEAQIAQTLTVENSIIVFPNTSLMYSFDANALVLTLPNERYMFFNKVDKFAGS